MLRARRPGSMIYHLKHCLCLCVRKIQHLGVVSRQIQHSVSPRAVLASRHAPRVVFSIHTHGGALTIMHLSISCPTQWGNTGGFDVSWYQIPYYWGKIGCQIPTMSPLVWRSRPVCVARGSGDSRIQYLCQPYGKLVHPIRSLSDQLITFYDRIQYLCRWNAIII